MTKVVLALIFLLLGGVDQIAHAKGQFLPGQVLIRLRDRHQSIVNVVTHSALEIGLRETRVIEFVPGLHLLYLERGRSVRRAIQVLRKNREIEYVQPNYYLRRVSSSVLPLHDSPREKPKLNSAPKEVDPALEDPELGQLYAFIKTGIIKAWSLQKSASSVIVAVLDTGIDYNHVDLSYNLWRNEKPGEKGDVVGYDFLSDDGLPYDDVGHGTVVSGVIGAVGGNGVGISGAASRVSLMSLRVMGPDNAGSVSDAIKAMGYAVSHGAKILNASWGVAEKPDNHAFEDAMDEMESAGVLIVAAAGNDGRNLDKHPVYPAAFEHSNVLTVGSTDKEDQLAYFSNYGKKTVHLTAPGVEILSTYPKDLYQKDTGTSVASPMVSGTAALIWAKNPTWKYDQVKKAILSTVDPIEGLLVKTVSGGRLNALQALKY